MNPERIAIVVPAFNEPRIGETLEALHAQQRRNDVHHYVVDNASTDETVEIVHRYQAQHDDFPLTVVHEEQKGTGAATDTGFRRAIADGCTIIARTDADSQPARETD